MALSLRLERRAFLWRVRARAMPAESNKPATLDEVVSVLEAAWTAGKARVFLDADGQLLDEGVKANPKNQLYIAQIKRDPSRDLISILVNRGDPDWVDPALLDPTLNKVRVERPSAKEAPGWSAHLLISTKLEASREHRACFEKMPRLSGSLILAAFDRMVTLALETNPSYTYEVIKKGKKPKIEHRNYRPTLEIRRSASETLAEDLERGVLSGITLTRERKSYAGIGVDPETKKVEEKIIITLAKLNATAAEAYLAKIIPKVREEFESMQVHISELPGGQSSNPVLPLDEQEALETLYVRAKRLTGFDVVLEQCYQDVSPDIESKMYAEICDNSNWS